MADRDVATAENFPSLTSHLRERSPFPWTDPDPAAYSKWLTSGQNREGSVMLTYDLSIWWKEIFVRSSVHCTDVVSCWWRKSSSSSRSSRSSSSRCPRSAEPPRPLPLRPDLTSDGQQLTEKLPTFDNLCSPYNQWYQNMKKNNLTKS